MISKDALEYFAQQLCSGFITPGEAPAISLPKDVVIHDLEKYHANRRRLRGTFTTASSVAFGDYVERMGGMEADGVLCFVDADAMTATAIFNIGGPDVPGHADHRAVLKLEQTAAYKALLQITAGATSQQAFAEWCEDWIQLLEFEDAFGDMTKQAAVRALRELTIDARRTAEHKVESMAASRSTLESVEARSRDRMPTFFRMACAPYHGLQTREIRARIGVRTSAEAPTFMVAIIGAEALREEIAAEFAASVGATTQYVDVLVGSFLMGA